ncbi:unnamed protein product [Closterium sp. NIES-53]
MMGRTFEAHCGFQVPPPTWDLVYAPMLLGLLVLLVAVLLSTVIVVLAWKRRNIEKDVKEIQLCTAILERAERSKSEAVASTSHELRTPIIGMMGMIEELLESPLEEWQRADLVDARACAGETVELINRVLDLAKLQAGRLQLETLPCCLRRIVREATTFAPGKNLPVTVHVDDSVPETLHGDPTRLLQVMAELVDWKEVMAQKPVDSSCNFCQAFQITPFCVSPILHTPSPPHPPLTSPFPPAASAMNNTATGLITIRLWCIPPPHVASTPPPLAAASGATQASSNPPPPASAWHELASCVRRFPPPTRLLCLPQYRPASQGGPMGNKGEQRWCGQVCSRDGVGSADDRHGGGGRLEEEVREWVVGACAVREEDEWMVVVACEDTGGGMPPEELWGLLDPHVMYGSGQHKVMERIRSLGRAESWKGLGRAESWRKRERSTWDPMQRDRKAAAGPRWTPYPVRFLLSTSLVISYFLLFPFFTFHLPLSFDLPCALHSPLAYFPLSSLFCPTFHFLSSLSTPLPPSPSSPFPSPRMAGGRDMGGHGSAVHFITPAPPSLPLPPLLTLKVAEMRGGMAVLSHASTGTTILLALPLGGGEDASSSRGAGQEESGEEFDESEEAGEERVGRESGLQGGMEGPAGAAAQPTSPPKRPAAGARALVRVRTCPQAEMERAGMGREGVEEAEQVVRGVVAGRGVAVVDDNVVNRMVARRRLQGYGAHVLLLYSGEEALQALSSATPSPPIHLLLLDLHMPPGIDGFETARRLRAMEDTQQTKVEARSDINELANTGVDEAGTGTSASRQRLCIIALTADLDAGIKRACLEAGMDGAVRKPIVAHELAAALSAAGVVQMSLFDHTSDVSPAPAATADSTVRSRWTTRDAVAPLAVRSHLPSAERAHFGQYKTAQSLYDAVVARYSSPATAALSRLMLPCLFPDLAAFATVADLITHLRTSDARYRSALPTELCA